MVVRIFVALLLLLLAASPSALAQSDTSGYQRMGTFGFFISGDYCIAGADIPRDAPFFLDTVPMFVESPALGFSMGMLYEHDLLGWLSIRALPGLVFMNGKLKYRYPDGRTEERSFERTEVALSLQLMPYGVLPNGNRGYIAIGPSVGCDLAANPAIQRFALRMDVGGGFEIRVSRFRMATEVRAAWSGNSLAVEPGTGPLRWVEGLYWNTLSLRLVFKG